MSSPKNISETHAEYWNRIKSELKAPKQSDKSVTSASSASVPAQRQPAAPAIRATVPAPAPQPDDTSAISFSAESQGVSGFSPKTQVMLDKYNGTSQKKIMQFWYDMNMNFGQSKVRQEFGDEPGERLMQFAASLDRNSYRRLKDNLDERLKKGQEWPPSFAVFKALKDTPTDREILEARTNILTLKKPVSRVEIYISKRKSAKLRTLSEKHIAAEFRTLYLEAFEEVEIYDRDIKLDERESAISEVTNNIPKSEMDKDIDDRIAHGYKLPGKLGDTFDRIQSLRSSNSHVVIDEID
ncbi:hypothetical protein [Photobacterium lutimaris]|uniref:Uncharacterized protein n=1 Tax=Photobacterium lutimaris TaxID=388278 RepID=A0A2T3ISI1_9GAMM|nr:hypothetical protein [Photobacterium lutimaris]PSU31312.1 hypothetical protein C9I99_22365 [Photobacterium lutimaris]TDR71686.1 hypothetical protein DFP78_11528 [Photobacterium lutimaris]